MGKLRNPESASVSESVKRWCCENRTWGNDRESKKREKTGKNTSCLWPRCLSFI